MMTCAAPALAQPTTGRAPARPDTLPHRAKPFTVMLRSAAVPGWGQLYNHKILKAAAVVGVEGFLVTKAIQELKLENEAIDRGDALAQDAHRNKKINWIWWGIAAHLLSMADAYVDAHLASFDTDFGPPESAVDIGEKPRLTVAYVTRF